MIYRVYDASTDKTIRIVDIATENPSRLDILRAVQAVTLEVWYVEIDGNAYPVSDIKAVPCTDKSQKADG